MKRLSMSQVANELESIRVLKARYCRFIDQKRFEDLAALFEPDCRFDMDPSESKQLEGRFAPHGIGSLAPWLELVRSVCVDQATTVHHVHSPEIELQSESSASGIWAMEDYVDAPSTRFRGYGHYLEDYRKSACGWRIARWRLIRLRIDLI